MNTGRLVVYARDLNGNELAQFGDLLDSVCTSNQRCWVLNRRRSDGYHWAISVWGMLDIESAQATLLASPLVTDVIVMN